MSRRVTAKHNLAVVNPSLAKEWHPKKNEQLKPTDVTPKSHKKVWWQCRKRHEWAATVLNRANGSGCPYCQRRLPSREYNLATEHPHLKKEWDREKNTRRPEDYLPHSKAMAWWKCAAGHRWRKSIVSRDCGSMCPCCPKKPFPRRKSVAVARPSLASQWDQDENGQLKPSDVSIRSSTPVWWKCTNGHSWRQAPKSRAKTAICPYCSNRYLGDGNSLDETHPDIAQEWATKDNLPLTTKTVTEKTRRSVTWQCPKGHKWRSTIRARIRDNKKCPYCTNRRVTEENCLATVHPNLAKQWDATKNAPLSAADVVPGSGKKVFWLCEQGHSWKASVKDRARKGSGCPYCTSKTSMLELRVLAELSTLFDKVQHRKKVHGKECDVFLPAHGYAIEIDGGFYHEGREDKDRAKRDLLLRKGVQVMNVRHDTLPALSAGDVTYSTRTPHLRTCQRIVRRLVEDLSLEAGPALRYLKARTFVAEDTYLDLLKKLPGPVDGQSLSVLHPEVAAEFHPTKNRGITVEKLHPGSDKKVWWRCKKGHVWRAAVYNRTKPNGTRCPYCSGARVTADNNLAKTHPDLAQEWHESRNQDLLPSQFLAGSTKIVWWRGKCGHEWKASANNRSKKKGTGCPYCNRRKPSPEYNLATVHPELASQWHVKLNGKLKPTDVLPTTGMKVWWKPNARHPKAWKARVRDRLPRKRNRSKNKK